MVKKLTRFGVSIEKELIGQFDRHIGHEGYSNRSEALRDIIRDHLVLDSWYEGKDEMIGTLTIVYDHHKRNIEKSLNEIQHNYHDSIISVTHVHMDKHNCLEVLIMRGKADTIKKVSDVLIGTKGVKHGKLVATKREF